MPATQQDIFSVLGDPTRRALFERLCSEGELTVSELTGPAGVSQPAVSRHLAVMKRAGMVRDRHHGRVTHYRAEPQALAPLIDWIGEYDSFWRARVERLEALLQRMGNDGGN